MFRACMDKKNSRFQLIYTFSEKTHEIKEILVRRGAPAGSAPPPKSATGSCDVITLLSNKSFGYSSEVISSFWKNKIARSKCILQLSFIDEIFRHRMILMTSNKLFVKDKPKVNER